SAVKIMRGFGYNVSATHHEASPGQHEIDLGGDDALRTADAIVTLKFVVRALAARANLVPTFMPKPLETSSGSGIHLSQVMVDRGPGAGSKHQSVPCPGGPFTKRSRWDSQPDPVAGTHGARLARPGLGLDDRVRLAPIDAGRGTRGDRMGHGGAFGAWSASLR